MNPINKLKRKPMRNGGGKPSLPRKNGYKHSTDTEQQTVGVGSKGYQKASQSRDKYRELAREALVAGDRVAAEGFFQYADHYSRILNEAHELAEQRGQNERNAAPQAAAEAEEGNSNVTQLHEDQGN